jgi:paraquat-inducible protein B
MPPNEASATQSPDDAPGGPALLPLDRLDRAVLDVTAKLKELQATAAEQARRIEAMERQATDLEQQHAVAEAKLAVEMMHSAGLAAQASQMLAVAIEANVPALSELLEEMDVGGTLKSRLAQIYDTAFDAKAAELGIEEPARFREA